MRVLWNRRLKPGHAAAAVKRASTKASHPGQMHMHIHARSCPVHSRICQQLCWIQPLVGTILECVGARMECLLDVTTLFMYAKMLAMTAGDSLRFTQQDN